MSSKKLLGLATIFIVAVMATDYLQNGREMSVYNSYSLTAGVYKEEHLIVVVNRLYIPDKKEIGRASCRERV